MWEAREILWAVGVRYRYVVILARAVIIGTWLWALSTEYSVGSVFVAVLCVALGPELECSVGVRELTSSISYARCLLLGYVRSALRLHRSNNGRGLHFSASSLQIESL